MRVAIIGNMNNNANNLIRYLRREGVDATLLFFSNEANHFRPEADNIDAIDYPCVYLSWGSYAQLFTTPAAKIDADLRSFDFLIGSRLSPAYAAKCGRSLDIFMPTGGELHMLPMFSGYAVKDLIKFLLFSRMQRNGIRRCRTLFWDATNTELEEKIRPVVDGLDRIKHAIPAIYYPDYEGDRLKRRLEQSQWMNKFREIKNSCDVFLVHHVKHVWLPATITRYGTFHAKGNDQVVKGLAQYYSGRPTKRIVVAMMQYGADHVATRKLAEQLGVSQYIEWFPQLPRKELMLGIGVSDAVIGEVTRSWFSYGTVLEAMAMSKPVLHNRDDSLYGDKLLYPMLRVFDATSVASNLNRIARDEVDLAQMGLDAKQWLVHYGMGEPVREIIRRIDQRASQTSDAQATA